MQKWEEEKGEYMKEFGTMDDEAQKLGLKSTMPKEMFGESGIFRGVTYADYKTLRRAVIGYLEDKALPTGQRATCFKTRHPLRSPGRSQYFKIAMGVHPNSFICLWSSCPSCAITLSFKDLLKAFEWPFTSLLKSFKSN